MHSKVFHKQCLETLLFCLPFTFNKKLYYNFYFTNAYISI